MRQPPVSVDPVQQLQEELAHLRHRMDRDARRRRALGLVALVATLTWGTAHAQLVQFVQDSPALATDVNANFNQLKTWLETKVGAVTSANVTAAAISATSVTTTGAVNGGSVVATGSLRGQTLTVTNGLPITVEADVQLDASNGSPVLTTALGSTTRRVCFLATYYLHDTMADESVAECHVERDGAGTGWQLRANVDLGSGDPDLTCVARCITW